VLTIRQEQYSLLSKQTVLSNPRKFVNHARSYHPRECGAMDEEVLTEHVRSILAIALDRGILATRDLLTFLDLAMVFGLDWSGAKLNWLNEGLHKREGGTISDRLRRLRLEAIYRLEAEAASQ